MTIGGPTAVARNVISGEPWRRRGCRRQLGGHAPPGQLRRRGPDRDAAAGQRRRRDLINLSPGATIGGTASGAGNVISANAKAGVSIQGYATFGAAVLGNFIGTNKTGSIALGNGADGVDLGGMSDVTIGGAATGSGTSFRPTPARASGSSPATPASSCRVTVSARTLPGPTRSATATGIIIEGGSSNNTIGGTTAGAGNTIAYSATIGVDVDARTGLTKSAGTRSFPTEGWGSLGGRRLSQ